MQLCNYESPQPPFSESLVFQFSSSLFPLPVDPLLEAPQPVPPLRIAFPAPYGLFPYLPTRSTICARVCLPVSPPH